MVNWFIDICHLGYWWVIAGFLFSALGAWLLIYSQNWHGRLSMDFKLDAVQKSHLKPVPRVGGVAIFFACLVVGFLFISFSSCLLFENSFILISACGAPAFAVGLWEDLTKKVSVFNRLLATFISAALAAWLMGAVLPRLNIPVLDAWMLYPAFAVCTTVFAVAGVSNAVNIIDGFNGLASGVVVILGLGFAGLAAYYQDVMIFLLSLFLSAVTLGFMLYNFPKGKIFLGDGGAYFLGFYLAQLAVLTTVRHHQLSAWTILTILSYPVVEVIFSIVRRKVNRMSPGLPDRGHLHQLIQSFLQQLIKQRKTVTVKESSMPFVNSQVSPVVWAIALFNILLAFLCMADHVLAFFGFIATVLIYLLVYAYLSTRNC